MIDMNDINTRMIISTFPLTNKNAKERRFTNTRKAAVGWGVGGGGGDDRAVSSTK